MTNLIWAAGLPPLASHQTTMVSITENDGFEMVYSHVGIASVFTNGCVFMTVKNSLVACYRIWCCRSEPKWDEGLEFMYATLFRILRKSEEMIGTITFKLPESVWNDVKAARAARHQGEGI